MPRFLFRLTTGLAKWSCFYEQMAFARLSLFLESMTFLSSFSVSFFVTDSPGRTGAHIQRKELRSWKGDGHAPAHHQPSERRSTCLLIAWRWDTSGLREPHYQWLGWTWLERGCTMQLGTFEMKEYWSSRGSAYDGAGQASGWPRRNSGSTVEYQIVWHLEMVDFEKAMRLELGLVIFLICVSLGRSLDRVRVGKLGGEGVDI